MKLLRAFWPAPIAAGLLLSASFPPLDQGWCLPLAWALLFTSMRLRRGAKAGRQALVAALLLFIPGLWWIAPLVWPLWLFVAAWCAGYEALFGWAAGRLLSRREVPPAGWVVAVPAMHLLFDMLRTVVLSGFPWLLSGYSAWRNPVLLGSADLLGVHGATLALLMLAACLAEAVVRVGEGRDRVTMAARALVPAAAVWAVLAAWAVMKPAYVEEAGPTVLLLQPNIPQILKETAVKQGRPRNTSEDFWTAQEKLAAKGFEESAASGRHVDLVVWAETMVPNAAIRPLAPDSRLRGAVPTKGKRFRTDLRTGLRVVGAAKGAQTLAGIETDGGILVDADGYVGLEEGLDRPLLYNTVVLLDADARVLGFQDKQHLTPGGEYIPLVWLIPQPLRARFERYLTEMAGLPLNLRPGESSNLLPLAGGGRAGVLICYESVFPEIPRGMVRQGATVLVNCSNYGWFAGTAEMEQALAMCAFRAAELRRTFVLSSNNGVSAVIGPDGLVRASTPVDQPAYLLAETTLCTSISPFALVGEAAAWAVGFLGAALTAVFVRRSKTSPPGGIL